MTENIQAISRELYDNPSAVKYAYLAKEGLTEEVVRKISEDNNEPEWMLNTRLEALKTFEKMKMPDWGPSLANLDLNQIVYYADPNMPKNQKSWDDVPAEVKETFEKLGIPEAEREALAGVGGQMDSKMAYHNLKEEWENKGVIFLDMDEALQKHPELVKQYFTTSIPINDHKFAALHYAVWSGGTFLYIPKDVKIDKPLQAYFRMNQRKGGQFEHTLIIVEEGAQGHYVEGCFTAGAKVQTLTGRKNIEDIQEGDFVLTHTGQYQRVYHTQKQKYSGDLYEITYWGGSTQPVEITDKHPLLFVKRKYQNDKNADWQLRWGAPTDLKEKDYLVRAIPQEIATANSQEIAIHTYDNKNKQWTWKIVSIPSTKEFFRLAGYYVAEGSISDGYYLNFSFGNKERKYINDVKRLLKSVFGVAAHETHHKKNNGTNVVVNSVELCRIFSQFGFGASNKQIPEWMLLETPEKQQELLLGAFRGDGNIYANAVKDGVWKEVVRYNSTSKTLAHNMQDILLRLGIPAFINAQDRSKQGRKTMYTVGISGLHLAKLGKYLGFKSAKKMNNKKRASMFHIDEKYVYLPIRKIEKKVVKNVEVYNFGVENDESYTAQGIISHNCSAPKFNESSVHAGAVEVIVKDNARFRYSSVENWSINTYNLNTKRGLVHKNATLEWVGGNLGSGVTMLYPCSMLIGEGARAEHLAIAFASEGQNQDTGAKVFHIAPKTTSQIVSKSIAIQGGITAYRGLLRINKGAKGAKSNVECDALMIDNKSQSNTYPFIDIQEPDSDVGHEATVGRISDEQVFYLMSRGISEEDAIKMLVTGFMEPITKELPIEYAVEMNKLIELEMEGSIG